MNRNDCLKVAEARIAQRGADAAREAAERTKQLYAQIPEFERIDRDLRAVSERAIGLICRETASEAAFAELRAQSLKLQQERARLLVKNGLPEDYLAHDHACELCRDTGYTADGPCRCLKRALSEVYLQNSNLQTTYRGKSFRTFDTGFYQNRAQMDTVLEYCRGYVRKFDRAGGNLLLTGVPGCGKTHLSAAIGTALIASGHFVLYTPVQQMIAVFEASTFGKDAGADPEVFNDCDLLIIDDLGAEMQTAFSDSVLYGVINNRINLQKPMIVSTNLTMDELGTTYHERLCSRLAYEFVKLAFDETDVRREKKSRIGRS